MGGQSFMNFDFEGEISESGTHGCFEMARLYSLLKNAIGTESRIRARVYSCR
jgi:hypothetical protein